MSASGTTLPSYELVTIHTFDEVRKKAYDIHDHALNIIIRLWKDKDHQVVKFCLHLDKEKEDEAEVSYALRNHTPWKLSNGPPCRAFCGEPNRLIYQLNRYVYRYFQHGVECDGNLQFVDRMQDFLRDLHYECICCGRNLHAGRALLRSAACTKECSVELRKSQLRIRCTETRIGWFTLSLLLDAAQLAVEFGHFAHLPPLPIGWSGKDFQDTLLRLCGGDRSTIVKDAFNGLKPTELFMSWIQTSYRGCLVWWNDCPRTYFPNLDPGLVFLVNSKHETETAFLKRQECYRGHTALVFHGTSLDRLYPILWEGLQVLSSTNLSYTGRAAFGKGIYLAKKSSDAAAYCSWPERARTQRPFYHLVLLVCELLNPRFHRALNSDGTETGYYLTSNPQDVILRAVVMAGSREQFTNINTLGLQEYLRERTNGQSTAVISTPTVMTPSSSSPSSISPQYAERSWISS
ncbi:hypothetical protein IQ07DRAFT_583585 [Pyrenochaeta sp. DS3sAY3a]|nr:hypothetical protein IQ07DRAFT_583585 [Pyrenochaeta sp. DS3sAY3a]